MNKSIKYLFFILIFIIPFIDAISISSIESSESSIYLNYLGDSKEVTITFQNTNNACNINCEWQITSEGIIIDSDSIYDLPDYEYAIIKSKLTAKGNSPNYYIFEVICENTIKNIFCGSDTVYKTKQIGLSFGFCGDAKINGAELCDGNNLNGNSCQREGYSGGNLNCINCKFDYSNCYKCGDEKLNFGEECDTNNFGTKTCSNSGYISGMLKCTKACEIDYSDCSNCGNGLCDNNENCGNCISDCKCSNGYSCVNNQCGLNVVELKDEISEEMIGMKEEILKVETKKNLWDYSEYIFGIFAAIATIVGFWFNHKSKLKKLKLAKKNSKIKNKR